MSIIAESRQISIEHAINEMVEVALPKFSENKIMTVNIMLSARNFHADKHVRKEINFVIYRPQSYTFVGRVKEFPLTEESEIEYLSYHDSCWRSDGIGHTIGCEANEMTDEAEKIGGEGEDWSIYNNFGFHGAKIIDGIIATNSNDRIAKFKKAPKIDEDSKREKIIFEEINKGNIIAVGNKHTLKKADKEKIKDKGGLKIKK